MMSDSGVDPGALLHRSARTASFLVSLCEVTKNVQAAEAYILELLSVACYSPRDEHSYRYRSKNRRND